MHRLSADSRVEPPEFDPTAARATVIEALVRGIVKASGAAGRRALGLVFK
jgi:hypothetical protein